MGQCTLKTRGAALHTRLLGRLRRLHNSPHYPPKSPQLYEFTVALVALCQS